MIKVFVDTDVIMDFLTDRRPYSTEAAVLFNFAGQQKIEILISSLSFSNLYYILRRLTSRNRALQLLRKLDSISTIVEVNGHFIHAALASEFKNFEDAIQYFSVVQHKKVVAIVTRNVKDYKLSELPVLNPNSLLKSLRDL